MVPDDDPKAAVIAARIVAEAKMTPARTAGPFPVCPFPNAWCPHQPKFVPFGSVPKDKWDPLSERFRSISAFNVNEPASTNNLSFSPKFISYHLQAKHIRDTLATLGPGAQVYFVDIKDCFRNQQTHPSDWHLCVIYILGLFYVDTHHTFGNVVSEWSWQAILAILRWGLPLLGVLDREGAAASRQFFESYVDNMFLLSHNSDPSHLDRLSRLHSILTELGLPLHEEQFGPEVNALGWDWDLVKMLMSCPEDKYHNMVNHLKKWQVCVSRGQPLRFKQLEKLIGIMSWVSAACPSIVTKIGALRNCEVKAKRTKKPAVFLDPAGAHALRFLLSFMSTWNRSCSIFHDFSPCHSWEHLIRVDASTSFGAGGFSLPSGLAFIREWTDEERALAMHLLPIEAPAPSSSASSDTTDAGLAGLTRDSRGTHAGLARDSSRDSSRDSRESIAGLASESSSAAAALLRESTTVLELLGVFHALHSLGPSLRPGSRVQVELDNQVAVLGLKSWFSPTAACLAVLDRIHTLVISLSLITRFEFIPRIHNHIADALSLNDFSQAASLFSDEFSPSLSPGAPQLHLA